MSRSPLRRILLALTGVVALVVVSACQSAPAPESAPPSGASPTSATDPFPVSITHAFGTTTVPTAPTRVLTVGFNEQDFALAFGVEPIGVREFLGYDAPNRPWAPASVRGKQIPTVGSNEINFEKVAELDPDLILAVNSYIDKAAYAKLAAIAPTVAQSGDVATGATTWQDQTTITGKALGQSAKAAELITTTEQEFTEAKQAHPAFAGKSASFALGSTSSGSYSLGADDYRMGWLTGLGFTVPATSGEVSFERLDEFATDVLIGEGLDTEFTQNKLFTELAPVQQGRYVDLGAFDGDIAGALGFNSPLSLPFLLDAVVPQLAAVTDGDPATTPTPYAG